MKNQELAKIFYNISQYLAMEKVPFKPQAYRKSSEILEALETEIEDIYQAGGIKALEKIPSIGPGLAKAMAEYIETGTIRIYEELKKRTPVKLEELMGVEGLGPQKTRVLYQKLKIKDIKDLEKAAKAGQIAGLFGFGAKTEKNILEGIAFLKRSKGRFLLGEILPQVREVENRLKELKEIESLSVAGSVRRRKETIGDIDLLAVSKNSKKVMAFFVSLPGVAKIWSQGSTRSSIRMKAGFDMDLRVVPQRSFGSALQYFTGSKEHNIATRKIAIEKGLKLNEYGVFRGGKMIAGKNEEEVYRVLGLQWPAPELRENRGEVQAAGLGKLPALIKEEDIKGDLHCHSDWNGGENSIEELIKSAKALGYSYLGISDHTKYLKIENGLDERALLRQRKEIDKINSKLKDFKVLQGAETNILNDGRIDIKDEVLKQLDYVIVGIHSSFKMGRDQMTERIIRAMRNPQIKILAHPTGRILKKRDEYQADFDKVLRAAKEYNVALEINAHPVRLDLNDQNIRRAKEAGIKMAINTDTHRKEQLRLMEFGVAQARRGWAEKRDIINSWSLSKLMDFFK
jgi:DNA polymerase (family 10)